MERVCEFCTAFRPVVYCKADAAHLCLCCDSKVHSANALSCRHPRTLLCDSCRFRPTSVRCLDHRMFACRGCDKSLHGVSSQHQRQVVGWYTGCPSAKHFAVMWGFRANEAHGDAMPEHCSEIGVSSLESKGNNQMFVSRVVVSSNEQTKMYVKGEFQQENAFILEQILELEKLQLNEGNNGPTLMRKHEQNDASSSVCNPTKELSKDLNQGSQQFRNRVSDLPQIENSFKEVMMVDLSPFPFSQVENLSSSSTVGDSFWQSKFPSQDNQLWYQNMQDLGVCEDIVCPDDFNIPDVDVTFRNFEELFGADQGPIRGLVDDNNIISCSSLEKDASFCKLDSCNDRATELDASVASSAYFSLSAQMTRDESPSNESHDSARDANSLGAIRPSFSSLSFSLSRFSGERSGADCPGTRLSPRQGEVSCSSPRSDIMHSGGRDNVITRLKEKKKMRNKEKQVRYASRKAKSDARRRTKGGIAGTEGCGSDIVTVTKSY